MMSGLGMGGRQGSGGESAASDVAEPAPAPAAGEEEGLAKIRRHHLVSRWRGFEHVIAVERARRSVG
jgi:hypothetical protein